MTNDPGRERDQMLDTISVLVTNRTLCQAAIETARLRGVSGYELDRIEYALNGISDHEPIVTPVELARHVI